MTDSDSTDSDPSPDARRRALSPDRLARAQRHADIRKAPDQEDLLRGQVPLYRASAALL